MSMGWSVMNRKRVAIGTLIALWTADGFALDAAQVFSKVSPSVVVVNATDSATASKKFGSGVVVAPERVVTNCHVLKKTTGVTVKSAGKILNATLEYPDVERDLCQLRVEGLKAPAVAAVPLDKLRVGQRVYAVGNPRGLELTLSEGLISAIRVIGQDKHVQTTASITYGSSGGGLFDDQGRLLATTTSGLNEANLNFAVPAEYIQQLPQRGGAAMAKLRQRASATETTAGASSGAATGGKGTAPAAGASPDSDVRVLTVPEIKAHFSAYPSVEANASRNPFTLTVSGQTAKRDCPRCKVRDDEATISYKRSENRICFRWNRVSYPESGCFRLVQTGALTFELRNEQEKTAVSYSISAAR